MMPGLDKKHHVKENYGLDSILYIGLQSRMFAAHTMKLQPLLLARLRVHFAEARSFGGVKEQQSRLTSHSNFCSSKVQLPLLLLFCLYIVCDTLSATPSKHQLTINVLTATLYHFIRSHGRSQCPKISYFSLFSSSYFSKKRCHKRSCKSKTRLSSR